MAREENANYDQANMVIRFTVAQETQYEFLSRVSATISAASVASLAGVTANEVQVGLFQAAIGGDRVEWELRVSVPNLERMGRFMDRASSGDAGERKMLESLTSIERVEVHDRGVPLYRGWTL